MAWLTSLAILAILACGLMGGMFFAFSCFVVPALERLPPAEGIRAMQRINIDVYHWSFMATFFATPAVCVALAVHALGNWDEPGTPFILAGSTVYLIGCLLVTGAGNVPLNNALARVDPHTADPKGEWQRYANPWVWWNHLRTASCLFAATAFVAALIA